MSFTTNKSVHSLWVHGELDGPETVGFDDLSEGTEVFTGTTSVVAVGGLEGPGAITLGFNLKGFISALGLSIGLEVTSGGGGQVSAKVGANEHFVSILVLCQNMKSQECLNKQMGGPW